MIDCGDFSRREARQISVFVELAKAAGPVGGGPSATADNQVAPTVVCRRPPAGTIGADGGGLHGQFVGASRPGLCARLQMSNTKCNTRIMFVFTLLQIEPARPPVAQSQSFSLVGRPFARAPAAPLPGRPAAAAASGPSGGARR
jgi:hypothetical protein